MRRALLRTRPMPRTRPCGRTNIHTIGLPDQLLALKGKDYKLTVLGDQAVNAIEAITLRINHPLRPEALLFFNKETGLPVKSEWKITARPEKKNSILFQPAAESLEVFFDDFREFNGIRHFTKLKLPTENSVDCEFSEVKFLKKLDSKAFKKPE